MVNDNNQNNIPNQDIDLDDVEVEILVIAKNAKTLQTTASFLSRRGWPTTVLSSVSQAIEFIAEKKPDFVLVSLNHPNPAMVKIPDLISGTFNLTCIGFIEALDTASTNKLSKSKLRYKIQGQASGPNLHRSIRKILAEKLNINIDGSDAPARELKEKPSEGSDSYSVSGGTGGGSTTVKGDGSAANGGVMIQKSSANATHGQGANLIKGEGGQEFAAPEKDKEVLSTGKYTMAKANRRSLKQLTRSGPESKDETAQARQADVLAALKKSLFGDKKAEEVEAEAIVEETMPSEELSATSEGPVSNEAGEISARAPSGPDGTVDLTGDEQTADVGSSGYTIERPSDRSLLERMVEATLESICKSDQVHTPLGESTIRVGVFPIDSPTQPGYLVFATAMAERSRDAWFKNAEKALVREFTAAGVPGRFEAGFWVNLPEVNFWKWSAQYASFTVTVNHEGIEITASFFPSGKALPIIEDPAGNGMVSLGIKDVSTDHPVNFKAYLHLNKNKKYYLYLRNGRKLQPEQKKRLEENKITSFHMKSVDKENIRMFLAAAFLSDTIRKLLKKSEDEAA